jgi:hypothetical protein
LSKTKTNKTKFSPLLMAALVAVSGMGVFLFRGTAEAAPFTSAFIRLDRMSAVTATGGRVCANPATVATEATVQVTFPTTGGTDYIVNGTASNWTVTTSGLDSGQTAWPGIGTATNVTGKVVTFPSSDLTPGNLYCFNFAAANTLTTSSAGAAESVRASITTRTSAPANIDSTTIDLHIITNDQIVVTGTVPPSFTFTLSGNTDSFTTDLSTSSTVSTSGRNVSITTNAPNGWVVWVKGLNDNGSGRGALNSVIAGNYKIAGSSAVGAAAHTLTSGTEDYGLGVLINTDAGGGGTVSLDAAYDGNGSQIGTIDPTGYRPVASANGTANGDIITLLERATIAGQTPAAADYTDTLTVVGAGRF